jgi:VanZ family protein
MRMLFDLNRRFWPLVTLALLAAITALSLSPLPELPSGAQNDKLNHFIAYASLALPVALARPRFWLAMIAGLALWSGLIEIVQPRVNRYGEWADFVANAMGLGLGVVLAAGLRRLAPHPAADPQSPLER